MWEMREERQAEREEIKKNNKIKIFEEIFEERMKFEILKANHI